MTLAATWLNVVKSLFQGSVKMDPRKTAYSSTNLLDRDAYVP